MVPGRACALLLLLAVASPAPAKPPAWLRPEWGQNPLWDDGLAEVNVFDTTTTLHGAPRPSTMVAVFSATRVASNGAEVTTSGLQTASLPAIKMTIVSERIDTPDFPYDLASTVLSDRRDPSRVFSSVATSHDWNGLTAKRYIGMEQPHFEAWSTGGVREVERDLPPDVVPLEAVPLFLRAMDFTTTASFRCLPTLMAHRIPWSGAAGPEPEVLTLQAAVDGEETTTTAAGTFDCYRVKVTTPNGRTPMVLWLEKAFPNRLVFKTTASGKVFSLRGSERRRLAPSDPR